MIPARSTSRNGDSGENRFIPTAAPVLPGSQMNSRPRIADLTSLRHTWGRTVRAVIRAVVCVPDERELKQLDSTEPNWSLTHSIVRSGSSGVSCSSFRSKSYNVR
jgi:hypothetical protein